MQGRRHERVVCSAVNQLGWTSTGEVFCWDRSSLLRSKKYILQRGEILRLKFNLPR